MQSKTGDIPTELDHAAACIWVSGGKLTYNQMMGNAAELPPDAVIEGCINVEILEGGLNFTLTTALGDLYLLGEIAGGGRYEDLFEDTIVLRVFGIQCRCVTLRPWLLSILGSTAQSHPVTCPQSRQAGCTSSAPA